MQKITIARLRNSLSLKVTFENTKSVAIPTDKTIATHVRVHLPVGKVLILRRSWKV